MIKYLAAELQKYCKKDRNRIVFINGMDINELSLEMWSLLGFENMDASVLSRVLHGERLFSREQLWAFSKILHLGDVARYDLENALGKDLLNRHLGFIVPISQYNDILADSHTESLVIGEVRRLREVGAVLEALQVASFFEQVLEFTPKVQDANKSFLVKILNEKVRCLIYIEKPTTLMPKVRDILPKALGLAHEINDHEIVSMAEAHIGGCYYVAKMSLASAQSLEKSYTIVNDATKVEYVRTLLNDYAFLGDTGGYKETYRKAVKILDNKEKYNQSHIVSLYEALGRSLSLIGETRKARTFLSDIPTIGIETFFKSEVLRGKMFICYQEYLKNHKVDLDEAKSILLQSKKYSLFKRHRAQITGMYQEMCYA